MGIGVLYGQSQKELLQKCFDKVLVSKDIFERSFFIVPETLKFDVEHEYLKVSSQKGMMKTEVLSFSRFCRKLLDEAGMNSREYIDAPGQTMLVYRILKENPDKFLLYKNLSQKPGFVISLVSVIGEMKRFLLDGDMIEQGSKKIKDKVLAQKTSELAFLIKEYDRYLKELSLFDPSENYLLAANIIEQIYEMKKSNKLFWPYDRLEWIFSSCIKITGFAGKRSFTPQEFNLIKVLGKCCDVEVTAVCDKESLNLKNSGASGEIFQAGARTVRELGNLNSQNDRAFFVDSRYPEVFNHIDKCLRFGEEIPYLASNEKEKPNEIKILKAMSERQEISLIAGEIKRQADGIKYRYSDIALVTTDQTNYVDLVKSIFRQAGIPVFTDEKKTLYNTALGELVDCLCNVITTRWSPDSVINFLRCGICMFDRNLTDEFENFLLEKGMRGKNWIFDEKKYKESDKNYLLDFIKEAMSNVIVFEEKITPGKGKGEKEYTSATKLSEALNDYLKDEKIYEKVEAQTKNLSKAGDEDIALGLAKAWNMLLHLISSAKKIAGDSPMNIKGFKELIRKGMESSFSGTIPSSIDQVHFSHISQLPARGIKILFAAGLSEDLYPGSVQGEGLFRDKDREVLSEIFGISIPSVVSDKIYEDKFVSYSFLTLPEEKLYLSSPKPAPKQSSVIEFVEKCFPSHEKIEYKINPGPSDTQIFSVQECIFNMIRHLRFENGLENKNDGFIKTEQQVSLDYEWTAAKEIFIEDINLKQKIEQLLAINKKSLNLNKISAEYILGRKNEQVSMSISQIEKYMRCAYSHLMTYILKLSPRQIRKINLADTGNILHAIAKDCIEDFICEYNEKSLPEEREALKKSYKEMDFFEYAKEKLIETAGREGADVVLDKGVYAAYGLKISYVAASFLSAVFNGIGKEDFIPGMTEWEFSKEQKTAIEIDVPGSLPVFIRGKIDRIDEMGEYFRVIDYKSSDKSVDFNDLFSGISVQLPAYIYAYKNAFPDKMPKDALYMQFSRPILDYENINKEKINERHKEKLSGEYKLKGMKMEGEDLIATAEHGKKIMGKVAKEILSGKFPVNPKLLSGNKLACEYCDFNSICGFETKFDSPVVLETLPEIINEEGKREKKQTVFIEMIKSKIDSGGEIK